MYMSKIFILLKYQLVENIITDSSKLGRPKINIDSLNNNQLTILQANYKLWKRKEIKSVNCMYLMELKKNAFYKILKEYENI